MSRKRLEKNAMLLVVVLFGFAMMTLGVALLILGEVPFLSGKRIPAVRSRLIGAIFVAFLPLALGVRQLSNRIFGPDAVQGPVVVGLLLVICLWGAFGILFRVIVPKRESRASSAVLEKENPFQGETEAGVPWTEPAREIKPTSKRSAAGGKPSPDSRDPFDFS